MEIKEPTMELASCPTIHLPTLKKAIKEGTVRDVEILDTVSGKSVTVGKMVDDFEKIMNSVNEEDVWKINGTVV